MVAWSKAIFLSPMSPAVAFAFVLFAAGSTVSMAALAYPEVSSAVDPSPYVAMRMPAKTQVLGDSISVVSQTTVDDSSLEATNAVPTAKISAKAVSYDSTLGRWNYNISYSVSGGLSGTGSITIGTYVLASGLTSATGTVQTGSILKPSMLYHVTLWVTDASGNNTAAAEFALKTKKAGGSEGGSSGTPCLQPQTPPSSPNSTTTASSTSSGLFMPGFCIKEDNGAVSCSPTSCRPPMLSGAGQASSSPPGLMHMPRGHFPYMIMNSSTTPSSTPPQMPGQRPPPPPSGQQN